MRLRSRLFLSLLALTALMTIPAVYAVGRVHTLRSLVHEIRTDGARAANGVGLLRRGVSELDRLERAYVATADPDIGADVDRTVSHIAGQAEALRRLGYGEALVASGLPLPALGNAADSVRALVDAGALEEATTYLGGTALPLLRRADVAVANLSGALDRRTEAAVERADASASAAALTTVVAMLAALLLTAALSWMAARRLSRPLERLRCALLDVGNGRFDPPADPGYDRSDEVGDLFRSFRSMATRLTELDRTKAEIVGDASHDLKTPVAIIAGYAELLEEELHGRLDAREERILGNLLEQARALGARADHLLAVSRMESRGLRPGVEEIRLRHFAGGVARQLAAVGQRAGIRFEVRTDESAPTFIVADPDSLRDDILRHLVDDALHHTPPGGRVEIRFSGGGGRLVIEVEDDGAPIDPQRAAHVFDRYARSLSGGRGSSAAGFPIARAAVEAHGGAIAAFSDGRRGVRFRIDLPLRPRAPMASARDARPRHPGGTARLERPGATRRPEAGESALAGDPAGA